MACAVSVRTLYGHHSRGLSGCNKETCDKPVTTDTDFPWMTASPPGKDPPDSGHSEPCSGGTYSNTCSSSAADYKDSNRASPRNEMKLGITQENGEKTLKTGAIKRKAECLDDDYVERIPSKRISPFLNTPKERKDERRRVLKISVQKLRSMEDPEHYLMRSVLINNTLKKVQKEIREEKKSYQGYKSCIYRLKPIFDYDVLNNNHAMGGFGGYFDDPFAVPDEHEKVTDEITESLCNGLTDRSRTSSSVNSEHQSDNTSSNESSAATLCIPETNYSPTSFPVCHNSSEQHCSPTEGDYDSDKIPTEMEVTVIKSLISVLGDT
ncbi:hypothetical protein FSP39_006313 [Pinctada imbricata]|uniref:SERTA domain-containing protein n=1 Tax=Pinctada imbricata TaxID=66713 RepID=A0AA89BRD8_PINIB|nr:hypothetical protein FSP39_006313 [Pinctada imbricata]